MRQWLGALRDELAREDMSSVRARLQRSVTPAHFVHLREQKLISRAPSWLRTELCEVLTECAQRVLSAEEASRFAREAVFCRLVEQARASTLERLNAQLRQAPQMGLADLLRMSQATFFQFAQRVRSVAPRVDEKVAVAENERRLHEINGMLNDVGFATARVVNEFARTNRYVPFAARRISRPQLDRVAPILRRSVKIAGELNSLEWMLDSVAYGEFCVDQIDEAAGTAILGFADPRCYLMRTLALRRRLVANHQGRRAKRWLREQLLAAQATALGNAVSFFLAEAEPSVVRPPDLATAQAAAGASLSLIDAEDDLLVAAAGEINPAVAAYYYVAMGMRWYALGAGAVHKVARGSAKVALDCPAIPLNHLMETVLDRAGGKWVAEAIDQLTLALPARSHLDLMARPFVKDGSFQARPFLGGDLGDWNANVRNQLIQGGALGRNVGRVWETFYEKSFENTDWSVIGRGVKLKRGGKTLTDIDLLLLRNDLLLVLQIKALIGLGGTTYDHWRNRQTVELGCRQARTAADFLSQSQESLVSICGKRRAEAVRVIQPAVLTNVSHFDGWTFECVPVMGEVTRKAICEGARVDYFEGGSGRTVHHIDLVRKEELSTAKILELLAGSIELEIAVESTRVGHHVEPVAGLRFAIPTFLDRDTPGVLVPPTGELAGRYAKADVSPPNRPASLRKPASPGT
jgi:hypothetical protein